MKIAIINKSDRTGGAAIVSMRLMQALQNRGMEVKYLTAQRLTDNPAVSLAASPRQIKKAFMLDRLAPAMALPPGRIRKDLFKIDTATATLPLHRHPDIIDADIIMLNWINQGVLSLEEINRIAALSKPIVWTMHDMWNSTALCHHPHRCTQYNNNCRNCPLTAPYSRLAQHTWQRKQKLYDKTKIQFIAVSRWLESKFKQSPLTATLPVKVIPNPFQMPRVEIDTPPSSDKKQIIIGAARLDDPIKGLPILIRATQILSQRHPDKAQQMHPTLFGSIRNEALLDQIAISHTHLGTLSDSDEINRRYATSHIVVSSSLHETLPGTLIEGQACGALPVSFNSGGQTDIITHLDNGYLATLSDDLDTSATALADGLLWACKHTDNTDRQQLTAALRQNIETRFSADAVAKAYIKLFAEMKKND